MKTKHLYLAVLAGLLLAFGLLLGNAAGVNDDDDDEVGDYNPDARPGNNNPVTSDRASLFRDDELWLLTGDPTSHTAWFNSFAPTDAKLDQWNHDFTQHAYLSTEYAPINSEPPAWSSARGRITSAQHDQIVYSFYRPDGKIAVELWDHASGRDPNWVTFSGTTGAHQSVAVTTTDLDRAVDTSDQFHDEVIVARIASGAKTDTVEVSVLNQQLVSLAEIALSATVAPMNVEVAAADVDDDGNMEIVVGQQGTNSSVIQLDLLRFNPATKGSASLTKASTTSFTVDFTEVFDMACGDFNGDAKEDVAVAVGGAILFYQADTNAALTLQKSYQIDNGYIDPYRQSMTAGLFLFDPDNDYGVTRRQLALFMADDEDSHVYVFAVTKDFNVNQIGELDYDFSVQLTMNGIIAGNFVGHDGVLPLEDIAISYNHYSAPNYFPEMVVMGIRDGKLETLYSWQGGGLSSATASMLQAVDNDGDSYRLGVPAHIVIQNLIALDYALQEPPKHVDYLPVDPDDPTGEWDVLNISGRSDFVVELEDDQEQSVETSCENEASMSIGASVDDDAGMTVSEGFGDIAKAKESVEDDTKVGYDFKASESNYNSQYGSRSVSYSNQTNIDDNVHAKIQVIDIWRYPILAMMTDDDTKHGFQEIILPGTESIISSGAGKDHGDWYQPYHQNHNVLSYPHFIPEMTNFDVPDLGSFSLPDGTLVNDIMNEPATYYWNGNEQTIKVSWTSKAGSEQKKSYEHTLSVSEEVTIGESAKVKFEDNGVSVEDTLKLSFDSSVSLGGTTTETSENSSSRGVTIDIPEASGEEWGYAFQTAIYVSSDGGAFKVAHATDPMGGQGSDWWKKTYGQQPDPALNLPNMFIHNAPDDVHLVEYWTLNQEYTGQWLRGFFLKDSTPNPITGKNDLLGASPADGDVVQLCTRVYNYSLFQDTGDFDVNFYYVAFDNVAAEEVGSLMTQKNMSETIMLTSIARADGAGYAYAGQEPMQEVCVDWNTKGLSNTVVNGKSYNTYRFYVIIDEDDAVKNEIHEWKDADGNLVPAGNNQGFWPWKNAVQVVAGQSKVGLSDIDISLQVESLALKTDDGLVTEDGAEAQLGETYELRVAIQSTGEHPHFRSAVLYDGDPDFGGAAITTKTVFGLRDGESHVWFDWTPQEEREHELWVEVIEDVDEVRWGNARDRLTISVKGEQDDDDENDDEACGCSM